VQQTPELGFAIDETVLRSLHFMLVDHDLF
jgi:hypothetical protein